MGSGGSTRVVRPADVMFTSNLASITSAAGKHDGGSSRSSSSPIELDPGAHSSQPLRNNTRAIATALLGER